MRLTVLGVIALVALAGCLGGGAAPAADSPDDGTTTDPSARTGPDTVAFATLNERQQAAFEAAVDGEARFVPNTSYVDASEGFRYDQIGPFEDHEFVRYEGERYRLDFTMGELYATYRISASPGDPGANDTVVALDDLPAQYRDAVRQAITGDDYHAPYGKWDSLPEPLGDAKYVRHGNETYHLGYTTGDMWAPVLDADPVE